MRDDPFTRLDRLLSAILNAQSRLDAKPWWGRVWDVLTRKTENEIKRLIIGGLS